MKLYVYVDNSNLFIEGQRVSAVRRGMAFDMQDALRRPVFDFNWHIEYGKLFQFFQESGELSRVNYWGAIPPEDSFWKMVESDGFHIDGYIRSSNEGRVRNISPELIYHLANDVNGWGISSQSDIIILVTGDEDLVPVVDHLVNTMDFNVHIAFWNHASRELKEAASYFINLDQQLDRIRNSGPNA